MSRLNVVSNAELAVGNEIGGGNSVLHSVDNAHAMRKAGPPVRPVRVGVDTARHVLVAKTAVMPVVVEFDRDGFGAAVGPVR